MSLASRLQTHTATIQYAMFDENSLDGMGGKNPASWVTRSTQQCLVQPLSGKEILSGGQETMIATHRLFVMDTPDIRRTDRVVVGSTTYDVVFVENSGGISHHLEVLLKEVD